MGGFIASLVDQTRLKPLDNLSIKGIEDDEPVRRGKKRRGRKPFVIQTRFVPGPNHRHSVGISRLFRSLKNWHTHSRYHTESARDQAYATLVKKAEVYHLRGWSRQEFRKGDD